MSENSEKSLGTEYSTYRILPEGDMVAPLPEAAYKTKSVPQYPKTAVANITYQYARRSFVKDSYIDLEYNFGEIAKAEQTDSYVMRSFLKHVSLMLKGGWYLDGRNEETVSYIYERIMELEYNTNKTFSEILRELVTSMVSYCNAFLILVRDERRSSGKRRIRYNTDLAPIAGVFPADVTSMEAKTDYRGRVTGWRQNPEGQTGDDEYNYSKHSTIHIAYNRKPGFISGTPWILPALDDIRSWRRLEELSEVLASRYTFPLLHYSIGTDQHPAVEFDQNDSEITQARKKVEAMPSDGVFITSHRHKITAVGLDGAILDLEPYIKYWEQRVIAGLNLSAVDLGKGDTANKSTAQQMSKSLADFCTDMRAHFAEVLESQLFNRLLEEGGYKPNHSNRVKLKFPVIDEIVYLELEKHHQYMFQNNTITESEMRRRLGQQPITDEMRKETYYALYDVNTMEKQAEIQKDLAKVSASQMASKSQASKSGQATKVKKRKNKAENVNKPTNQEGKLAAKTRPVRDSVHNEWRGIITSGEENAKDAFVDKCIELVKPELVDRIKEGLDACSKFIDRKPEYVGQNIRDRFFNDCFEPKLRDLVDSIEGEKGSIQLASRVETKTVLLDMLLDNAETAAFNLGFVYGAQLGGADSVMWKKSSSTNVLMPKTITFDGLLPDVEGDTLEPGFPEDTKGIMTDEEFATWNVANYLIDQAAIEDGVDYLDLVREIGQLSDKKLSTKQRKKLKDKVFCGPDRSFPVNDCAHYTAALRLLGRYEGPGKKSKIKACIERRGKKLGCEGAKKKKKKKD